MREFFGNMPGDSRAVLMLPSDWRHYCEAWPSIPQHLKDLGIGRFQPGIIHVGRLTNKVKSHTRIGIDHVSDLLMPCGIFHRCFLIVAQ